MSENSYRGKERRKHVRVSYPEDGGPRLTAAGRDYRVADISERGIKFIAGRPDEFPSGLREVRGTLSFPGGENREIRGAIIRQERREDSPETGIALFLYEDWGIPAEVIARELEKENG